MSPGEIDALIERASNNTKDTQAKVALARLISLVERGGPLARDIGRAVYSNAGHAYVVGITGSPGAGKSTITDKVLELASKDGVVCVLAIDPTSPFSGGAILGDRVRMNDHVNNDRVYIRSMATRGHLGGLTYCVPEVVRLVDALGFDLVIIETVGVGQVEVEIAGAADTTLVVVNPGWGDSVQANKAGLMEIADIFVINKADRPNAKETKRDLQAMLDLAPRVRPSRLVDGEVGAPLEFRAPQETMGVNEDQDPWSVPIVNTVATQGTGIEDLYGAILSHREHLQATKLLNTRRRERNYKELVRIIKRTLEDTVRAGWSDPGVESAKSKCVDGSLDPYSAAEEIIQLLIRPVDL